MDFSNNEALILNHIQRSFPLVRRPFAAIGEFLDISESEVMAIIADLKNRRVIRNIAAIFNPQSLGYTMGLVGITVPPSGVDQAASVINAHPGVSHNYLRDHRYNIWFTLAEQSQASFDASVDILNDAAGASDSLILKTEQVFKIGVKLAVDGRTKADNGKTEAVFHPSPGAEKLTVEEKSGIILLQQDLPVVSQPFSALASGHGSMSENRLLELAASLQQKGTMRRYAAVLRHMKAGFTHNAMTVWKLSGNDTSPLNAFLWEDAVSHLYNRTVYPGKWEYPLFAMIHAKSASALEDVVHRLSRESGIRDYQVLRSLREFKKQRVVYFSDQFDKWYLESRMNLHG